MTDAIWAWMDKGGPVMWPLLGMSVAGMGVTLKETGCLLVIDTFLNPNRWRRVMRSLSLGDLTEALNACRGTDPVSSWCRSWLNDPSGQVTPDINGEPFPEKGMAALTLLATISALAPLMGILGTVLGIIQSFSALGDMAAVHEVSAGIAQALVSTAAGLIVSMAAMLPHNFLVVMYARRDRAALAWAGHLKRAWLERGAAI